MKHIFCLFLALQTLFACAQRINPTTQIKRSPGLGYILRSNNVGDLNYVLDSAVPSGPANPTTAPAAGQSPIYVNSATGQTFTWNGSTWNVVSGAGDNWGTQTVASVYGLTGNGTSGLPMRVDTTVNGLATGHDLRNFLTDGSGTKLNTARSGFDWNGSLSESVTIRGLQTHPVFFDSLSSFRIINRTSAGAAYNVLNMQPTSAFGIALSSVNNANTGRLANVQLNMNNGRLAYFYSNFGHNKVFANETGISLDAVTWGNITARSFKTDTTGFFFNSLETATPAFSSVMTVNPLTNEVAKSGGLTPIAGNALVFGASGWTAENIDARSTIFTPAGNIAASDIQSAIEELDTEKQADITTQDEGVNTGAAGTATVYNFTGAGVTATQAGNTLTINVPGGGGGGGDTRYSAGNGAIVLASGTGVTFTRTTSSVWTFNIPAGVELKSFDINNTPSQSATAALDLDFVFAGTRPYNQDASTDMTDLVAPIITTVEKLNPGTYPNTSATNFPAWTIDVTTAGILRVSTTEFTEVGNGGANSTSIKGVF